MITEELGNEVMGAVFEGQNGVKSYQNLPEAFVDTLMDNLSDQIQKNSVDKKRNNVNPEEVVERVVRNTIKNMP